MSPGGETWIVEQPALRGRTGVFGDRDDAGRCLASLVGDRLETSSVVLGIPAGGVPVAAALAAVLELPLFPLVISKIILPWNTEVGVGAVAFDGTCVVNDALVARFGLDDATLERAVAATRRKVARRVQRLAGGAAPAVAERTAVLVDDGLASGYTMRVAVQAVRALAPARVLVAVPTASERSLRGLTGVDGVFCANIRPGTPYAVADAYRRWHDVTDDEAAALLGARPRSR